VASETELPERLRWRLAWRIRKLMPVLRQPGADGRLRDYWLTARRMREVLARASLSASSLSIDVEAGLATLLRWLPGRRVCVDPLAEHYAARFELPLDRVSCTQEDGEALPFVSGCSDRVVCAVCATCIDHADHPWAVVPGAVRVLQPGGWFWFACEENPPVRELNAGHPHALERAAIRGLADGFEIKLAWEEPWRGVCGHLLDHAPLAAMKLGSLARKPERVHAA